MATAEQIANWTDDRIATLRKLWAEGHSAGQIAGHLGGVSRNAVMGKVHRLGLAKRAGTASRSRPRARPRNRLASLALSAEKPSAVRSRAVQAPRVVSACIDLNPAPDGILDLLAGECRWPGRASWCCAPAVGPYCPGHTRVAYQTAARRRA